MSFPELLLRRSNDGNALTCPTGGWLLRWRRRTGTAVGLMGVRLRFEGDRTVAVAVAVTRVVCMRTRYGSDRTRTVVLDGIL
jgi:hypothetical protein